jgi:hypothetical protein
MKELFYLEMIGQCTKPVRWRCFKAMCDFFYVQMRINEKIRKFVTFSVPVNGKIHSKISVNQRQILNFAVVLH